MRSPKARGWILGLALLTLASPALVDVAPAAAVGGCPASCIAGNYSVHFKWKSDHRWIIYPLELREDHTGSFANGALDVTWTKKNGVFTISFDVDNGLITGSYVGFRNDHGGFNRRHEKGTMSNSEGNTGVWFAYAAAPPPT